VFLKLLLLVSTNNKEIQFFVPDWFQSNELAMSSSNWCRHSELTLTTSETAHLNIHTSLPTIIQHKTLILFPNIWYFLNTHALFFERGFILKRSLRVLAHWYKCLLNYCYYYYYYYEKIIIIKTNHSPWKADSLSASQEIPVFHGTQRFITAIIKQLWW
jgi:hypothetical protein